MKEKANAWGNAQDRDSRFVPEQKATADFLWVIYEIENDLRNRTE
jgi:hypothetical protein